VLASDLAPVLQRDVIHRQHDLEALASGVAALPMPPAFTATLAATHEAAVSKVAAELAAANIPGAGSFLSLEPPASSGAAFIPGASVGGSAGSAAGGPSHSGGAAAGGRAGPAAARGGSGVAAAVSSTRASSSGVSSSSSSSNSGAGAEAADNGAAHKKQGAYGKVPIHTESKLAQLSHLDEVWAAAMYSLGFTAVTKVAPLAAGAASKAQLFCEVMLTKTSRSFSMVIQQLPPHLRASVCVFYLVLRGLDTVEDDMEAFAGGREAEKLAHLRAFHE
jgi:hypothetical protein